jgi:Protein of unknown function (DUF2971)
MTPEELTSRIAPLYSSFINLAVLSDNERPLHLAHYTSLDVLEKIMQTNEIWFSNPLFMNDHQEMRFVLFEALKVIAELQNDKDALSLAGGVQNFTKISSAFHNAFQNFDINHALDVYVFCLSKYDPENQRDGLLSMWRGYGANGEGAALVFNTGFVTLVPESPLLIVEVQYANDSERRAWLHKTFHQLLSVIASHHITEQNLMAIGFNLFQLALVFSLTSKHPGFREEQEWRVIYLPDRDPFGLMKDRRSYLRRNNRLEPKLRFPIEPLKIEPRQTWTFDSIVERVVLGPTHSSFAGAMLARRMFTALGKPGFASKVWVSEIPYRPT